MQYVLSEQAKREKGHRGRAADGWALLVQEVRKLPSISQVFAAASGDPLVSASRIWGRWGQELADRAQRFLSRLEAVKAAKAAAPAKVTKLSQVPKLSAIPKLALATPKVQPAQPTPKPESMPTAKLFAFEARPVEALSERDIEEQLQIGRKALDELANVLLRGQLDAAGLQECRELYVAVRRRQAVLSAEVELRAQKRAAEAAAAAAAVEAAKAPAPAPEPAKPVEPPAPAARTLAERLQFMRDQLTRLDNVQTKRQAIEKTAERLDVTLAAYEEAKAAAAKAKRAVDQAEKALEGAGWFGRSKAKAARDAAVKEHGAAVKARKDALTEHNKAIDAANAATAAAHTDGVTDRARDKNRDHLDSNVGKRQMLVAEVERLEVAIARQVDLATLTPAQLAEGKKAAQQAVVAAQAREVALSTSGDAKAKRQAAAATDDRQAEVARYEAEERARQLAAERERIQGLREAGDDDTDNTDRDGRPRHR